MTHRNCRPRGMATLIALLVAAFVFVILFGAFDSAAQVDTTSSGDTRNEEARLAAEAGIIDAMVQLKSSSAWSAGFSKKALPVSGRTYTVTVKNNVGGASSATASDGTTVPGGQVYVISQGTSGSVVRTVTAMVRWNGVSPFDYAIFGSTSSSDLTLSNGAAVDSYNSNLGAYSGTNSGSNAVVGGNGNVIVSGGAKVNGDVNAGPAPYQASVSNGGQISGASTSAAAVITFPPVDATYKTPNANSTGISGGTYDSTTHDLLVTNGATVTLSSGTYYFDDVTVNGGGSIKLSGAVVIYLTGKLDISNGGRVNNGGVPANLQIYSSYTSPNASTPGVVLAGGSDTQAAIYAPNAGFSLSNGGHLYGSVVASSLSLAGGSRIHYDTALHDVTSPYNASTGSSSGGGLSVSSWDRK